MLCLVHDHLLLLLLLLLRVRACVLTAVACCCCSGTITVDEMRDGLRAKGSKIPESELQRIMENADVNGEPAAAAAAAAAGHNVAACTLNPGAWFWYRGVLH
jgi:hypothetical protein